MAKHIIELTEKIASVFAPDTPGAYPKGTIVKKVYNEDDDFHPLHHQGTVIGSIATLPEMIVEFPDVKFGYLVDFGDGAPTFILDTKITDEL